MAPIIEPADRPEKPEGERAEPAEPGPSDGQSDRRPPLDWLMLFDA
jgi:hypothetical protein